MYPFLFGILVYFTHENWGRFKVWVLLAGVVATTGGTLVYPAMPGWSYILESAGIAVLVGYLAAISQIDAKHPLADGPWVFSRAALEGSAARALAQQAASRAKHPTVPDPAQQSFFASTT